MICKLLISFFNALFVCFLLFFFSIVRHSLMLCCCPWSLSMWSWKNEMYLSLTFFKKLLNILIVKINLIISLHVFFLINLYYCVKVNILNLHKMCVLDLWFEYLLHHIKLIKKKYLLLVTIFLKYWYNTFELNRDKSSVRYDLSDLKIN